MRVGLRELGLFGAGAQLVAQLLDAPAPTLGPDQPILGVRTSCDLLVMAEAKICALTHSFRKTSSCAVIVAKSGIIDSYPLGVLLQVTLTVMCLDLAGQIA